MQRGRDAAITLTLTAGDVEMTIRPSVTTDRPLGGDGAVFQGCNVENASYGLGICAERVAVFSAVMTGAGAFDCIAIATEAEEPSPPCGACLQVLAEFAAMDLKVDSYCRNGAHASWRLGSLLPHPFTANLLTTSNG